MRKITLFFVTLFFSVVTLAGNKADWFLYTWSYTTNSGGDIATFETTDNEHIFVIDSCVIHEKGLGFSVHSADWATQYGWSDIGGTVTSPGVPVQLAPSTSANGWMDIPVGVYDVTFNLSVPSIRFDRHTDSPTSNPEPNTAFFLRGGDLSMVTYVEDWGTIFRYQDGTPGDVFDILQSYGVNFARLRLYNAPGTAIKDGNTTYRLPIQTPTHPSGYPYAGPDDILSLSRRAKAHDMAICLSFHLSDYWSNAGMQMIPAEWAQATSTQALGDSVYNYIYRYMTRMVNQGTTPEYVSVGNETNMGMLFQLTNGTAVSYGGDWNHMSQMIYLYNRAYDAVKAVSPTTQIIIHHSYGHDGKIRDCQSFFQTFTNNGGKFDIVGGSYYPYWASLQNSTDNTPTGMLAWAKAMEAAFNKPIMIMETGYSWTQYRPAGRNGGNYEGQLSLNGSYNEASEDGQAAFMNELHHALASDSNILGYLYWDPIFVDQMVNGSWIQTCWAERYDANYNTWRYDGNVVSNTTWFDYAGYPLKALWSEIASQPSEPGISTALKPVTNHQSSTNKVLCGGQLHILHDNKTYNILGVELK